MKITGTLVNYYIHCKRQCWLHGNKVNLEDYSELVKIGKQLHHNKLESNKNAEISIENIKIDKIKGQYLVEYKKSNADIKAASWQVLYYLYILKKKGITKKGKLICLEKNRNVKKTLELRLTDEMIRIIEKTEKHIKELILSEEIPRVKIMAKCKKCAYYTYCAL
ncbi:MAG: CRISPR-associated protein Cas4 [Anaeromicrobium sp.]|jgi:CRISPR-associated exonuclease Cas4|uniref:CRISPR-associated protein Cas4 n=1 Tax=Anaeromicrobium sp. TaxID=1929132 RepID=UPI0025F262C2|nr:CRISPR-associated protein Cas4 [Anaeromicrobium sp.]MCT4594808.1 CRISPR-associated protein Cas4 [Anaeromicrobium sp.]